MKEPYRKGPAIRPDPESCAGGGDTAGEALAGAHAGQPLETENGTKSSIFLEDYLGKNLQKQQNCS